MTDPYQPDDLMGLLDDLAAMLGLDAGEDVDEGSPPATALQYPQDVERFLRDLLVELFGLEVKGL